MSEEKKPDGRHALYIMIGLTVYVAVLAVLAADQVFGLGLFPPELDRKLERDIASLADASIPLEKRRATFEEVVGYHEFSVPHLIAALKKKDPALQSAATACLIRIGAQFFGLREDQARAFGSDFRQWETWWKGVQAEMEKRSS